MAIRMPSSRSSGSKPVTTIGTRYFAAIGSYSVQPMIAHTWPAARNAWTWLVGDSRSAVIAGGTSTWRDEDAEVVDAAAGGLGDGHRVRGRGGLEADGEEHDLLGRVREGDLERVERAVDDAHVGAAGLEGEQVRGGAGHAQHVAVAGEDDVRAGGDGEGLVDLLQRRHADRAAGPVDHPDALGQRLVDPLLDDRVRLAAADLHEGPRPGRDPVDLGQELLGEHGVAVLVEVLHATGPAVAEGGGAGSKVSAPGASSDTTAGCVHARSQRHQLGLHDAHLAEDLERLERLGLVDPG